MKKNRQGKICSAIKYLKISLQSVKRNEKTAKSQLKDPGVDLSVGH